ncbi:MmgE/PrpD family protein [Rhizobium ruizarguesonis]
MDNSPASIELRLAELIVSDAPDPSQEIMLQATRHVADLVGVALAGTTLPAFVRLVDVVGDNPQPNKLSARIWGSVRRVSLREAGLINAFAGHIHDFDDDETGHSWAHLTVTAATAALVTADACPEISGEDVLRAYIIATEVAIRLGEIVNPRHYRSGWHSSATLGIFAACAAAGRILGLTSSEMRHALGISASFAAGIRSNFGSDTKPLQVGQAVRNGIFAAEAAKSGLTSSAGAIFGAGGFTSLFSTGDNVRSAIDSFGKPYGFSQGTMVIKAYPCCTASHTAIYSTLALKQEHGFDERDIAKVTCFVDPVAPQILVHDSPTTGNEAKFSMPYSLAIAAKTGRAGIGEFTFDNVVSADVRELMGKVNVISDDTLPKGPSGASVASRLEITLTDGRTLKRFQEYVPGSAGEPMSTEALEMKFTTCASALPPTAASDLFRSLLNLGSVGSIATVIDAFHAHEYPRPAIS